MIVASQLRPGAAIRFQGQPYKIISVDYHPGQGKMGGVAHARLLNLETGTFWEYGFRSELKLDEISLEKRSLEFLYADADHCCFMDPQTYDQSEIEKRLVGDRASFLEAGMKLVVEFVEDRPVGVIFPDILEVQIADTAPPMHQHADAALKPAKLPNGIEIMVPQFVKTGDLIRLDLQTMRYMDRARAEAKTRG